MKISREYTFDSAHMLPGHDGKCARLHGHTYRMLVEVITNQRMPFEDVKSSDGMLLDFANLDRIVKNRVVDLWDHHFLARGDEWPVEHAPEGHVVKIGIRTTAENMASYACLVIQQGIAVLLADASVNKPFMPFDVVVTLYETPKSYARVNVQEAQEWLGHKSLIG